VLQIICQIRPLLPQLQDYRYQSLNLRHEFPPRLGILTGYASRCRRAGDGESGGQANGQCRAHLIGVVATEQDK